MAAPSSQTSECITPCSFPLGYRKTSLCQGLASTILGSIWSEKMVWNHALCRSVAETVLPALSTGYHVKRAKSWRCLKEEYGKCLLRNNGLTEECCYITRLRGRFEGDNQAIRSVLDARINLSSTWNLDRAQCMRSWIGNRRTITNLRALLRHPLCTKHGNVPTPKKFSCKEECFKFPSEIIFQVYNENRQQVC